MINEEKIKDIVLNKGADLCGISNIDRFDKAPVGFHPQDIYKECKSVRSSGSLPKTIWDINRL